MDKESEKHLRMSRFRPDTSGGWSRKDAVRGDKRLTATQLRGKTLADVKRLVNASRRG